MTVARRRFRHGSSSSRARAASGKTSLACATAIGLADAGKRVLLVSTDPASNLDEVLGVDALADAERGPERAGPLRAEHRPRAGGRTTYRERVVGPYRGVLPAAAVAQHGGAALGRLHRGDRGVRRVLEAARQRGGHGGVRPRHLRHRADRAHAAARSSCRRRGRASSRRTSAGTSCLGPLVGLESDSRRSTPPPSEALRDAARTTLVLVARPERLVARRGRAHARRARRSSAFATCAWFSTASSRRPMPTDLAAAALEARGRDALAGACRRPARAPARRSSAAAVSASWGSKRSARMAGDGAAAANLRARGAADVREPKSWTRSSTRSLRRGRGVVMTMGKGGVGKTTVAARIAAELARRGLSRDADDDRSGGARRAGGPRHGRRRFG